MEIRNSLARLLEDHDCVIIPGFGGFIGNYQPARIDPVNHTFHPPSKQLLFNVNLRHNDGLLASHLTRLHGISYAQAMSLIEEQAAESIRILQAGESLWFPGVGRLTPGSEGNIRFEQHRNANLLADSFGLPSFIAPPVNRKRTMIALNSGKKSRNHAEGGRRIGLTWLRRAAVWSLPLGVAFLFTMAHFDRLPDRYTSNAGILGNVLARFSASSLVEKKASTPLPQPAVADTPVLLLQAVDPAEETLPDTPMTILENTMEAEPDLTGRFAVIVGAFRQQENAGNLVNELLQDGHRAGIYDQSKGGLYRVAIAVSNNRQEALRELDLARTEGFPGAWLLIK